jgi:cytochrome c biogenesis protein
MGSLKLGVILLMLVALAVIVGTVVVQKPLAEPGQIENLYSPTQAKIYAALGLFDVFHAWWFTALLALIMVNLTTASAERFPVVWREVRRHRDPEEKLMRAMPNHTQVGAPLDEVAAALRAHHYKVKLRQMPDGRRGLTADRQRYARLAPYFVHLSLLIILSGGIIDSRWGYRGFMKLDAGEQKSVAQTLGGGASIELPYAIRCDDAGMEQYPDGSPKRYWSKLTVIEGGRPVVTKEIEVNSPLVYRGIRFFQSNFGRSGQLGRVELAITPSSGEAKPAAPGSPHGMPAEPEKAGQPEQPARIVSLSAGSEAEVPDYGLRVRIVGFYPDFYIDGDRPSTRSDEPNNPAVRLAVTRGSETTPVWVFANYPQFNSAQKFPYRFTLRDLELGNYTGLQVANQPGQWLVWTGCTILAFGLFWAFFFAHRQYWALEGTEGVLVAGMTSKRHEDFRDEFGQLIETIGSRC